MASITGDDGTFYGIGASAASATLNQEAFTQHISMGGNIQYHSIDQTVVGGDLTTPSDMVQAGGAQRAPPGPSLLGKGCFDVHDGFNDTILHFLGYLRLDEDVARLAKLYDGATFQSVTLDLIVRPPPPHLPNLEVEDLFSRPSPLLREVAPAETALHILSARASPAESAEVDADAHSSTRLPASSMPQNLQGGGIFMSSQHIIGVTYAEGGMQVELSVRQVNKLNDDDVVTADEIARADGSLVVFDAIDPMPVLSAMLDKADGITPADLTLSPAADTSDIIAFFRARDADRKAGDLTGSDSLNEGRYLDGAQSDAEPTKPASTTTSANAWDKGS